MVEATRKQRITTMKPFSVQTAEKHLINIIYSVESLYSFRELWLG